MNNHTTGEISQQSEFIIFHLLAMRLRLRYVVIFALGMIVMYALIAGWLVSTPNTTIPIYTIDTIDTTGSLSGIEDGSIRVDEPMMTGGDTVTGVKVLTWDTTGGSTVGPDLVISGDASVDDIVAVFSGWNDIIDTDTTIPTTNTASTQTKAQACAQADGNYPNLLSVFWSDTVTASTKWYLKTNGVLHYIVNVSNGTKFYYYYVCSTGASTQAKNLTNTATSKVVLSNGQVILQ